MSSTWRPGCSTPRRKAGFWCRRRWPARFGGRISARRGSLSSSKARPSRLRSTRCSASGSGPSLCIGHRSSTASRISSNCEISSPAAAAGRRWWSSAGTRESGRRVWWRSSREASRRMSFSCRRPVRRTVGRASDRWPISSGRWGGWPGLPPAGEVEARIRLGERAARAAMVVSRLFTLAEVPPGDEVTHETALLVAAETVRRLITRPTVVWIEDLQWADAGTRELLPFMMERLTDAPLLLVGNLRAGEEPPPWGKRTAVTTMQLEPLGEEDARVLLAAMLEERLPADVERALIGKAGGNPFYLSEIVATLRSMGVLIRDDRGRWRTTGPVDQVLPDTVQGALLARLDRLPPPPRPPRGAHHRPS